MPNPIQPASPRRLFFSNTRTNPDQHRKYMRHMTELTFLPLDKSNWQRFYYLKLEFATPPRATSQLRRVWNTKTPYRVGVWKHQESDIDKKQTWRMQRGFIISSVIYQTSTFEPLNGPATTTTPIYTPTHPTNTDTHTHTSGVSEVSSERTDLCRTRGWVKVFGSLYTCGLVGAVGQWKTTYDHHLQDIKEELCVRGTSRALSTLTSLLMLLFQCG